MNKNRFLLQGGLLLASPLLVWLALPGRFSFWPLLFICLIPLFHFLSFQRSVSAAFFSGLTTGMFFYVLQLYWIVSVLHQYGGLNWFLAVPAMLLLVFYMSVYLALFSAGFFLLQQYARFSLLLLGVPSLWVGLDWIRSWFFSGFPWMDIGYGFWATPVLLQAADLFGHFGYTFVIVFSNLLLFFLGKARYSGFQRIAGVAVLACILGVTSLYSVKRWHEIEGIIKTAETAVVGVAQGNVEQTRKWSPQERKRTVEDYVRLSRKLVDSQPVSLIVWPETALPFYPTRNEFLQPVSTFVTNAQVALLTGAPWYEVEQSQTQRSVRHYNSAVLMEPSGDFKAAYYKSHLVPYGEYVPLKKYLSFLAPLVEAAGNFSVGTIEEPLKYDHINAGVLICFESIFGNLARSWVENGANILINLTNDAWYGKSSAPHQSWAMTTYRAVETRRSLVRSANTGISGVIDPLGRIISESELFVEWAHADRVVLLNERTFFVRAGYLFAPICAAMSLIILMVTCVKARQKRI